MVKNILKWTIIAITLCLSFLIIAPFIAQAESVKEDGITITSLDCNTFKEVSEWNFPADADICFGILIICISPAITGIGLITGT